MTNSPEHDALEAAARLRQAGILDGMNIDARESGTLPAVINTPRDEALRAERKTIIGG